MAFEAEHGRPPTPCEAIELAQRATLDTRPDKHQPQAEAAQRTRWRAEATAAIGEPALTGMLTALTRPAAAAASHLRRRRHRGRPPKRGSSRSPAR